MRTDLKRVTEGDLCPHCKKGKLELVKANEPYNIEHLQCDKCDSTYFLEDK